MGLIPAQGSGEHRVARGSTPPLHLMREDPLVIEQNDGFSFNWTKSALNSQIFHVNTHLKSIQVYNVKICGNFTI